MILPRYSVRAILLVTAICAVVSLVLAQGLRGKPWAAGMSIGLLAVTVTLTLGALMFALLWALAIALRSGARRGERNAAERLRTDRDVDAGRARPPVRS